MECVNETIKRVMELKVNIRILKRERLTIGLGNLSSLIRKAYKRAGNAR